MLPIPEKHVREMFKDRRGKYTWYRVRVFPSMPVTWSANVQPTPIVNYRREVGDYNCWQQIGLHEYLVRDDEDSGWSEAEVETDNSLAAM